MKSVINRAVKPAIFSTRSLPILIIGQIVVALLSLVYGKLTALYIPPAEWGDFSLLFAAMTLLHSFLVTPSIQSFKAALRRFSGKQVIRFYSRILLLIYLIVAPIMALLAGLYHRNPVFGLIWLTAFGQSIYQFGNAYLNASGQHHQYVSIQIGYAIANVLILLLLIVGFANQTNLGLWQSVALLNGVSALLVIWHLYRSCAIKESIPETSTDFVEINQAYRGYVSPLLSVALWGWLINYADRYLIQIYRTDAEVGQYVMGYSLGSKLLMLVAPLLAFLSPQILELQATGQPSVSANPLLFRYLIRYMLLAGACCLLFYLGRVWLGQSLLSIRYEPSFLVGPIVAAGYLFLTSVHVLEVKWYAFGQTRYVLWHNILGALLNIVFNLLLIPRFGILGAATAALFGFIAQFLIAIWLFVSPLSAHEGTSDTEQPTY